MDASIHTAIFALFHICMCVLWELLCVLRNLLKSPTGSRHPHFLDPLGFLSRKCDNKSQFSLTHALPSCLAKSFCISVTAQPTCLNNIIYWISHY